MKRTLRVLSLGMLLAVNGSVFAQTPIGIPTFDVSSFKQIMETVKNGTTQIEHLKSQIQNQLAALEMMKKNINQFNFNDLRNIQDAINQLTVLQNNLESIYNTSNVDDFLKQFNTVEDYQSKKCFTGGCEITDLRTAVSNKINDENKYINSSQKVIENAFKTANYSIQNSKKSYDNLNSTLNKAKLAKGQMESLGAIIELLGQQNQTLLDLKNMMASQVLTDSLQKRKELEIEAARNAYNKAMFDF